MKNVFFNAYIILEDNQILNKKFGYFFLFSKKGTFSKKKFCPALIVKNIFGVSHWNLVPLEQKRESGPPQWTDDLPGSVRASRRSVGDRTASPAAAATRTGAWMPQGLGTPIAPIEAQADTEAEEDTEADTPVQASALAEDRVDTEAARAPIAETRVPGTALGKGTNNPRAKTKAYAHHMSTVAPIFA